MGTDRAYGATRSAACALAAVVLSAGAWGQQVPPTPPSVLPPSDYGHQFVTIGAPGNRAALASERIWNLSGTPYAYPNLGAVSYEYRMARTEVTVQQYASFVNAYAPFFEAANPGATSNGAFTGSHIWRTTLDPSAPPVYVFNPLTANYATDMSWRMAARYCNWLHNGRPTGGAITQDAFERGAYDTSTFTRNADNSLNDQFTRSPDALFWIPSLNEWTKAAHYDPNRYGPGPGQEGYWINQGGQDAPLVTGAPGVGQTSASFGPNGERYLVDVGAYANVRSPWGLLDTSGGVSELTEEATFVTPAGQFHFRMVRGSRVGADVDYDVIDYPFLEQYGAGFAVGSGLRLASSVPTPGIASAWFLFTSMASRRNRRSCSSPRA